MMKLSLEAIQMVDAIAQRGSFAAAAVALHRVPSAISHAVARLEESLGVALFVRDGRKVHLTTAGEALLLEGRELLACATRLQERVQRVATGWEAELTVAVDGMIPIACLFPFVQQLQAEACATKLRLSTEVLGGCWDALVTERADLVVGAPGDLPVGVGLSTHLLGFIDMVFCLAPSHPLAQCTGVIPTAQLRQHQVIAVADTSRLLPVRTSGWLHGQAVLTLPDIASKREAQLAGLGIGWLPRHLITQDLAEGRLLAPAIEHPLPPTPMYLAWRSQQAGKALQALITALKANPANWLTGIICPR